MREEKTSQSGEVSVSYSGLRGIACADAGGLDRRFRRLHSKHSSCQLAQGKIENTVVVNLFTSFSFAGTFSCRMAHVFVAWLIISSLQHVFVAWLITAPYTILPLVGVYCHKREELEQSFLDLFDSYEVSRDASGSESSLFFKKNTLRNQIRYFADSHTQDFMYIL